MYGKLYTRKGWRRTVVTLLVAGLALAWLLTAAAPAIGLHFEIIDVLKGGNAAAWGWAYGIAQSVVSYLNSWWGFALAVAVMAGIGMSWAAIVIKGVLQRAGFAFAVRYATWL
jgi:hypothetical protein